MIRSLRKRFIFSAMAAFGILMVMLVGGITALSYYQVEHTADMLLESALSGAPMRAAEPAPQKEPGFSFGYRLAQRPGHIGYYTITADAQGEITDVQEKGIWEPDYAAAEDYARQILAAGREKGKIGAFKYLMHCEAEGDVRLVLLDNSIQVHMLIDLLRTALLLGLSCMAVLFLILLPISRRVVRSYALHIEKQKQFITNAGHEIKTPVAIILSNLDAMDLIQGENKWSRNIRSQTDRLNLLLQRLLFMARIDEKSVVLATETLDLNAVLGTELETYGPIIAERGLHLACDLSATVRLRANRDYLQQLIHMLMDNAVQYADAGGAIAIALERRRRRVRICFANTVDSLPDCPPEALFDRFYRGDSARTQSGGGCGIGLSAARAIAEMHRGTILAEYDGEKRIRFTVELPA